MQSSYRHAASVIKPNNYSISLGIDAGMVSRGNGITITTSRNNDEWLECFGLQEMSNVGNHYFGKLHFHTVRHKLSRRGIRADIVP